MIFTYIEKRPLALFLIGIFVLNLHFLAAYEKNILSENANTQDEAIVQWAEDNLPKTGILKETKEGFVYLKVVDGYINQLFPKLSYSNYEKPPFFRRADSPGAHISVIYVDERKQTGPIDEIGQSFNFSPLRLAFVPSRTREYIVLQVESPDLEKLRTKYGLSSLLKGHLFHISIAKKKNFRRHNVSAT